MKKAIPATLLSRYLDQLTKGGLIERRLDAQDSRRTCLSLTPAGQEVVRDTLDTVYSLTGARLTQLDPQILPALLGALELLTHEDPA